MSILDQWFSKNIRRRINTEKVSTNLPQINKTIQMRPMSPKREDNFWVINKDCLKKSKLEHTELYIPPFSPKLKPRSIRIEFGDRRLRKYTGDMENLIEKFEFNAEKSICIRPIKESKGRKRLFSQDASRKSFFDINDSIPQDKVEKKLYVQFKNKGSYDTVLNWNFAQLKLWSPSIESEKVDKNKVSRLAQLLKFRS